MKKNRIESKFKIGDVVEYIAKNSLYEGMWFNILNRRKTKSGNFEYRVSDKIVTFWAREQDLVDISNSISKLTRIQKIIYEMGEKL